MTVPDSIRTNGSKILDSHLYVKVEQDVTNYFPVASAVFVSFSNVVFIVTADHVVAANPELTFRIPQNGGVPTKHLSHRDMVAKYSCDWIRDTEDDIAVIPYSLDDASDDIKVVSVEQGLAGYEDVKVGDEIFVLGCPSSVVGDVDPATHFVRNGIVSAKLDAPRIVLDAFVFPGNSGGPVFWKPSIGMHVSGLLTGPDIQGRGSKLVGIVSQLTEYKDEAFSRQTGHSRVTFEENSGLAIVISSSAITKIMQHKNILDLVTIANENFERKVKPVSK
jgi:S1-C subfamily serine protease